MTRMLNSYLKLLDKTIDDCSELLDFDKDEINKGLVGLREMKRKLCDDEYFQTRLLNHTPCFKNHSASIQRCSILAKQEILDDAEELIDTEQIKGLAKVCCGIYKSVRCTAFNAHKYCGKEAGEIAQELLEGALAGLLQEKCEPVFRNCPDDGYTIVHQPKTEITDVAASSTQTMVSSFYLLFVMFIIEFINN